MEVNTGLARFVSVRATSISLTAAVSAAGMEMSFTHWRCLRRHLCIFTNIRSKFMHHKWFARIGLWSCQMYNVYSPTKFFIHEKFRQLSQGKNLHLQILYIFLALTSEPSTRRAGFSQGESRKSYLAQTAGIDAIFDPKTINGSFAEIACISTPFLVQNLSFKSHFRKNYRNRRHFRFKIDSVSRISCSRINSTVLAAMTAILPHHLLCRARRLYRKKTPRIIFLIDDTKI